ncbi:MAG: hypothetical protein ACOZF0_17600 [Thermodesulfobacteriota bacterium]
MNVVDSPDRMPNHTSLLNRLIGAERRLTDEIVTLSNLIQTHLASFSPDFDKLSVDAGNRRKFHAWRRISFELHHRRSDLKQQREIVRNQMMELIQTHSNGDRAWAVFAELSGANRDATIETEGCPAAGSAGKTALLSSV